MRLPKMCAVPVMMTRNVRNCVTLSTHGSFGSDAGYVKNLSAKTDITSGEHPKSAILVPEAMPT